MGLSRCDIRFGRGVCQQRLTRIVLTILFLCMRYCACSWLLHFEVLLLCLCSFLNPRYGDVFHQQVKWSAVSLRPGSGDVFHQWVILCIQVVAMCFISGCFFVSRFRRCVSLIHVSLHPSFGDVFHQWVILCIQVPEMCFING